ncbi:MAG: hypothetical protein ACRD5J_14805 [Nitrososphaeraceae archaeon]
MTQSPTMKIVDEALKRAGAKTSEAMRSHAFRKGFMSICEQSGMKSINVKILLGHDIGVSGHYYRPSESDLLQDYVTNAAEALTISSEFRLHQENHDLKSVQAKEITILKEEIERNRQATEHNRAMMEAIKSALDAKSKASYTALKESLGWR